MVLANLSDFLGSDIVPAIGIISGAGIASAISGYAVDALKWSGTDKAAWASLGVKVLAGGLLYGYTQGMINKTAMQYVLLRGAALGSLVAIALTVWNRFAPFQLQVRPDSALLNVNPAIIGQRQTKPLAAVGQCASDGGLRISAIGESRS